MDKLTKSQRERIAGLSEQISTVQDEVWDAFETSIMGDAKFSVYQLLLVAENDTELPEILRNELFAIVNDARSFLIGDGTTYERAGKAHARLGEAEKYLRNILTQSQE